MDEDEFKATYAEVNASPCVFAKAILARCAGCSRQQKLLIAEREAVGCRSPGALQQCARLAERLRAKALFALKLTHLDGPLPHGKEIRVQCGGLMGLAAAMDTAQPDDVHGLVEAALHRYGDAGSLPYAELIKGVTGFRPRRRRRR